MLLSLSPAVRAEEMQHYALLVQEFNDLRVVNGINVDYSVSRDSAGYAVFDCPASLSPALMFGNKDGRLTVQLSDEATKTVGIPTVRVYSSFLTNVENSGDSIVRVLSLTPTPKFSATIMGNGMLSVRGIESTRVDGSLNTGRGTLVLRGKCNEESLKFMGTGLIQADDLEACGVSVTAAGTGQVGVWATQVLKIKGMGSTTVYYRGNPEIKKNLLTIGVKIKPLEQVGSQPQGE